jgi:DNA-binding phage protein
MRATNANLAGNPADSQREVRLPKGAACLDSVGLKTEMSDIGRASFLRDERSQVLALSDALASMHGLAISTAFADVARSRGVARIAQEAGMEADEIYQALADPACLDISVVERVVQSLICNLPAPRADDLEGATSA